MRTAAFWKLSAVSDELLLQDLSGLLTGGARVEERIVAHLAEVEGRRLHLKAATSSLFDYCLRRLALSESEAFHRITAARLARCDGDTVVRSNIWTTCRVNSSW